MATTGETIFVHRCETPLGVYVLASSATGLACVKPEDQRRPDLDRWARDGARFEEGGECNLRAAEQLDAYFAGELRDFDVPLDMRGTAFQRRVWEALLSIPYGETRSYGAIAAAIGLPSASRAVGAANGSNPVSIIVPCHRVIGANGRLTGYGGGVHRKDALLALESGAARLL